LTQSKKRLALCIIDFLSTSLKDGTLTTDDAESIEIAQSCIAESFKVDPSDKEATKDALGGQSLLSIYGVYEKLKGKSTASTTGPSSATEARPSTPSTANPNATKPAAGAPTAANPEAEALKSQGNAAMAKKEYASAIDFYTKALAITPLNPIYLSNRAAAYSASGKHTDAAADAEMAVATDPKYVKAWSRLGLAKFAMGDARGSMEAYQKGIEYEGGGGSEAMKRGLETAKAKVEELEKEGETAGAGPEVDDAMRGPPGGAGGMPDLAGIASMLGGGGGGGGMPDLGSLMSNPMFASMAQNLMSNPDMMNNIMNNPRIRHMADQFGGGAGGQGGPDLSSLMSDPSIAEM
jgi:small glutamine-rich tetratricopeptide repeat-containing protein alpha